MSILFQLPYSLFLKNSTLILIGSVYLLDFCKVKFCQFYVFITGELKDVEDNILEKFFMYQEKAEIYYVYHTIHRYMVWKLYVLLEWPTEKEFRFNSVYST